MYGVAILADIGFIMSLFMLTLAFEGSGHAAAIAILGARMLELSEGSLGRVVIEALVGDRFATIVGEAEACDANLIVLGEPGKLRLRDLFVGTATERVIRHSDRPVLVVKETSAEVYRRVLVAFDLSDGASRALETALTVAPNAEFRLVHAWQTSLVRIAGSEAAPQETLTKEKERTRSLLADKARRAIDRSGSPHRKLDIEMIEGSPVSVIRDALTGCAADLLAIGTHGRARCRRRSSAAWRGIFSPKSHVTFLLHGPERWCDSKQSPRRRFIQMSRESLLSLQKSTGRAATLGVFP